MIEKTEWKKCFAAFLEAEERKLGVHPSDDTTLDDFYANQETDIEEEK